MAFQFGFSPDPEDIESDPEASHQPPISTETVENSLSGPESSSVPVQEHMLAHLLSTLPERISFSIVNIESPLGKTIRLPRRDVYDVRVQLLQEGAVNDDVIDQIDRTDLRSGVYEGGFKTWECSLDLASLLLDRGPRRDIDELERCGMVVELGAGTALPSLVLFRHALLHDIPLAMTLADYNDSVLRLVTLPNLILTWAAQTSRDDHVLLQTDTEREGELELTPALLEAFRSDMESRNMTLAFLSGPWTDALASLVPPSSPDLALLILASETIYSPSSTNNFVDILVTLLKRVKMAKAMVAAKRIYFGVGGSVDGLKTACASKGAIAHEIENHGVPGMNKAGVERALVEVQMA